MRKHWLRITLAIILLPLAASGGLAVASHWKEGVTGMGADQRLRPCPDSPNCVCSEDASSPGYIAPLAFEDPPEVAWLHARQAVTDTGGHVESEEFGYLHAVYRTKILRFVDDLELRLDADAGQIHVRSASRIGYSDLGANRKRVERLRSRFQDAMGQ